MIVSKSFTAVGVSVPLLVQYNSGFNYSVSGTFSGTVIVEVSEDNSGWFPLVTATAAASGFLENHSNTLKAQYYRVRCSVFTSGTIVTSLTEIPANQSELSIHTSTNAKAGATSGFVVAVADDISLVTCPASKTASTLVVPITGLKMGQRITGFYLVGQIESAGNTVTVDAALRVQQAVAADVTDALVASMTQLSVIAETVMSATNASKRGLDADVAADKTYYILITATTGASCDIALQKVVLYING